MPDWRRLIIGDAFALDSRDKDFYRDVFLFVPFLLFAVMAVTGLPNLKHGYLDAAKAAFLSLLVVALMKERLVLIGAALGFICLQSSVSFIFKPSPVALAVSILTGTACFLLFRSLKKYKPSYSMDKGGTIATLLVMGAGGVCWYAILRLFFVVP